MRHVEDVVLLAVSDTQYSDAVEIDPQMWEFKKTTTKAGVVTGDFVKRKDLTYQEAHNLATVGGVSDDRRSEVSALSFVMPSTMAELSTP